MFKRKKEKQNINNTNNNKDNSNERSSSSFKTENYIMPDTFLSENLVVANIEYVSNKATLYGPMVKRTEQKYIFEIIDVDSKTKYREVFTGLIADNDSRYFNLPYVVNIHPLTEVLSNVSSQVPKYSLLLIVEEINRKSNEKTKKK